jgi:hypothetical protein
MKYLLIVCCLFALAACVDTTKPSTPASLTLTPSTLSASAGSAAIPFKAVLENTTGEVSWTLSPNLGTLSSSTGLDITYTPPATLPAATTVTLTASLGNLTAKATLTVNPASAKGFTITGKVQDYSAGAASLEAITNDSDSVPPVKVATGNIAADGSFSITLPETLEDKDLTPETSSQCPEVTQPPTSFKLARLVSLSVVKDNLRIGEVWYASSLDLLGGSQVAYVYVDRDVKVTGTCQEADNILKRSFNENFKKGWNLELQTFGETSISYTTPESVDLPWLFSPSSTDTTPPTVVSIDPPDGAKGVKEDVSIVITFSEKMDQAATEFSYESLELPTSGVTFSWNTDGTVLTIKPNDLLDYAAGDDPSIAAKTYAINISRVAHDISGNSLSEFNSSFSTLRVIVTSIYAEAGQTGYIEDVGGDYLSGTNTTAVCVGDDGLRSIMRGFFGFDLTSIPEGVNADEAKLIINKEGVVGTPYTISSVVLEHVSYPVPLSDSGDRSYQYNTPVLSDLGIFDSNASPTTGYLSSDVTSALQNDLINRVERGNRSQYRLRLDTNNDDKTDCVQFTSSEGPNGQRPFLNVVYYLP